MKLAGREFAEVMAIDFFMGIATGNVAGFKHVHTFWENPDVWTAWETIWDQGGVYAYPTTAGVLSVSSTNANDTAAGTGARTVLITGLDENYNDVTESIILNGLTGVNTTKQFIRVFKVRVTTAGSGATAAGDIYVWTGTITSGIPATVYATIKNGNNNTLMGCYTVPAGYTWFLRLWKTSAPSGKSADVKFLTRPIWSVFGVSHSLSLYQNNYDYPFFVPVPMPEKTDLEVRALSSASGTKITLAFDVILIKNTEA